ncbi:MAG: hypothetical protein A2075_12550 [Geobacteraceae bacterium GWC2_58_44]|nr:MAG: hypothetical protein A2075_12550 [Geobacteraceae bacterium GWC2_58_44]
MQRLLLWQKLLFGEPLLEREHLLQPFWILNLLSRFLKFLKHHLQPSHLLFFSSLQFLLIILK